MADISKSYSGSYAVFASGTIFAFSPSDELKLLVSPNDDFSFFLVFRFIDDGKQRDLQKNVDGNTMCFTCLNFDTGAGTSKPVEIATAEGKKMFLHFWMELVDTQKQARKLSYTIYIEQ